MPCYAAGNLTICRPEVTVRRRVMWCPWCKERRRFRVNSYKWYGSDQYCTWCGTHFGEEGYVARMSESARDRNRAYAKEAWQ